MSISYLPDVEMRCCQGDIILLMRERGSNKKWKVVKMYKMMTITQLIPFV